MAKMAKYAVRGATVLGLLCATSTVARATLITFSGGTGQLTSPYYENGFVVTEVAAGGDEGGWIFANGGLMNDAGFSPGYTGSGLGIVEIKLVSGGEFSLNNLYVSLTYEESSAFEVVGIVNGTTVASTGFGGIDPNHNAFPVSFGAPAEIDTLLLEGSGQLVRSVTFSDVSVTVPDRAGTAGLLGIAMIPLLALGARPRWLATVR